MRLFGDTAATRLLLLRGPAPGRGVTRRQVLRWGVAGTAALVPITTLAGCGGGNTASSPAGPTATPSPVPPTATPAVIPTPTPTPNFFTDNELQTVRAIAARIIPTDTLPGATEANAAEYINRLVSILPDETSPGQVYAGGPFSNRNPFPDASTGMPSTKFPPDLFLQFIPLTRVQLLSWRVMLLGSTAVPGGDFNDAVLGPVIGLRDQYRTGLAGVQSVSQTMFGQDFTALSGDQQDAVLAAADADFVGVITGHTIEGTLSAPEYGGNQNLVGWQLAGYDGDSQPLGYSIFDMTTMTYNERPDKPNSTANPDEDFSGVDAATQQFLKLLVSVVGTPHFG